MIYINGVAQVGVGDMLKATYDPDLDGIIALAQLVAAVCSETEADGKITTHKGDASAHHTKTVKYTNAEAIAAAKTDAALLHPSGEIVLWHGTIANIPSGWVICDGNNSTPNLLARFIEGVATAATNPGAIGGATSKTTAGHVHTTPAHTLETSEIPSHSHNVDLRYGAGGSAKRVCAGDTTAKDGNINTDSAGGGGSHSHGDTGSKTDSIADIRPLFYDIAFLMKT